MDFAGVFVFGKGGPADLVGYTESAADIFLVVFSPVPLGFTRPVVLAFFATVMLDGFFSDHMV